MDFNALKPLLIRFSNELGISTPKLFANIGVSEQGFYNSQNNQIVFEFIDALECELSNQPLNFNKFINLKRDVKSPAILAFLASKDILSGLERLSLLKPMELPVSFEVARYENSVEIKIKLLGTESAGRLFYAFEVYFILNLLREATSQNILPEYIKLPKFSPNIIRQIEEVTGVKLDFDDRLCIGISLNDANLPIIFDIHDNQNFEETSQIIDQVTELIELQLASGHVSLEHISKQLAISPRSLQRSMSDAGTNFQELLNKTRMQIANGYLQKTTFSIPEIAYLVGYNDPTSFHRAFKRFHDLTPSQARNQRM